MAHEDPIALPDGTSFAVVESSASSDGERIVFEITMGARSASPPRHIHPDQEESWTVQSGELSLLVGTTWRTLRTGESLSIAPGTVHTIANRSGATVVFHDVHEPALDFQEYIEDLGRLARAGKLSERMSPRTMLHGATVLVAHRPMQISASPVQRVAETLLAAVGRLVGAGV